MYGIIKKKIIEKIWGSFLDEGKTGLRISTFQHICFPPLVFRYWFQTLMIYLFFCIFVYVLQPPIWKNKVHSLHCTQWKIQSKTHWVFTCSILSVRDKQIRGWRIPPSVDARNKITHIPGAQQTHWGYSYVTVIYIHMTWLMVLLVAWF